MSLFVKMHPRAKVVSQAQGELDAFLLKLGQKHDLTYGEIFSLLGRAVSENAKWLVRGERHPDDPDKKGDEA